MKISTIFGLAFFCSLLLVHTGASAQESSYYGLERSGATARFGYVDLETGEFVILNPDVDIAEDARISNAAIDVRRNHYSFIVDNQYLMRLNLIDGSLADFTKLDVKHAGELEYNPTSDRYYAIDLRGYACLQVIDPNTVQNQHFNLENTTEGYNVCGSVLDNKRGLYLYNPGSDYRVYDINSHELLNLLKLQVVIGGLVFNPHDGLMYASRHDTRNALNSFWLVSVDPLEGPLEALKKEFSGTDDLTFRPCTESFCNNLQLYCIGTESGLLLAHIEQPEAWLVPESKDRFNLNGCCYNAAETEIGFEGQVYADLNESCDRQENEMAVGSRIVRFEPSGFWAVSGPDGGFTTSLPPGAYTAHQDVDWPWKNSCDDAGREIHIQESGEITGSLDFGIAPTSLFEHVELSITSTAARSGLKMTYYLSCVNKGTLPFTGTLNFQVVPFNLLNLETIPQADRSSEFTAAWDLVDMPVGSTRHFQVTAVVPPDEALRGEEVCAEFYVAEDDVEILAQDRRDKTCTEITASYDPNDISVAPRGFGDQGLILQQKHPTLSYTIRFQNIGNAPARDVVIRDTLDGNLNVNTIHFGAASHDYTVNVLNDNVLEFRFAGIELPGKDEDEPGSHGMVKYKLDLQESLPLGTQIHNRAAIYFDLNRPVITNTVVNTIGEVASDITVAPDSDRLELRSPDNGLFVLHGVSSLPSTIQVFSLLGLKVLEQTSSPGQPVEIDLRNFSSGRYIIRIARKNSVSVISVAFLR